MEKRCGMPTSTIPIGLERRSISAKRGFSTQREAKEYERTFMDQQNATSDILFSSLVTNYLEDMEHRLKPTTMENKRFIIDTKLLPYFGRQKVCDIDTIKIRKWQNELISFRDRDDKPFSQTYLKTVNNQMSAIMNYAVGLSGVHRGALLRTRKILVRRIL